MYQPSYEFGQIVAFCKTPDFTTAVRQAVNNEMFWRDLFQKYNLGSDIQNELDRKLPSSVKHEVMNFVPNMINQQLDNYTKIQIPSHVAKNLSEQITGFLNNHTVMQNILEGHSKKLNEDLEVSAKNTLDRVTNEDQYHQVTNSHLDNMEKRCTKQIKEFKDISKGLIKSQENTFTDKLKNMQSQVNKEIETLKNTNNLLDIQGKKIEYLESQLSSLKWIFVGITAISVGVQLYVFSKK